MIDTPESIPNSMEIREIEERTALCIRDVTTPDKIGETLGKLFPELWNYLQSNQISPAGPPYALYRSFGPDRVDIEAGFPTAEQVNGNDRVVSTVLPGGSVATRWHHGHYDGLAEAHSSLGAWLNAQGISIDGHCWEVYWTDPDEVKDPTAWRTEIFWQLGTSNS